MRRARRVTKKRPLPPRSRAEVLDAFPRLRQSMLASFDNCALSTLMELEGAEFDNAAQARGILFHRYAGEVMRTLKATGQATIPTEEALQILYEVCAQRNVPDRDVVLLPARERRMLRICAIKLVVDEDGRPREFAVHRVVAVERRLETTLRYPESRPCEPCYGTGRAAGADTRFDCDECGGSGRVLTGATVERVLSGQPDALLMRPPNGATVLDWKTTRRAPAGGPPRADGERGDHHDDGEHVSYWGYFQQRFYGLLVLRNYPTVDVVELREFYPLEGVARHATVYRSDLARLEEDFGILAELLDRALEGGSGSPMWKPSPGRHCSTCPAPQRCPIDQDVRVAAEGIATLAEAERAAAQFVVADQVRERLRKAVKAWVNERGPVMVKAAKGRYEMRFKGGRFGVHVPESSDRAGDSALDGAFAEAAYRVPV